MTNLGRLLVAAVVGLMITGCYAPDNRGEGVGTSSIGGLSASAVRALEGLSESDNLIVCDLGGEIIDFSNRARGIYNEEDDEYRISGLSDRMSMVIVVPGKVPGKYTTELERAPQIILFGSGNDQEDIQVGDQSLIVNVDKFGSQKVEGNLSAVINTSSGQKNLTCDFLVAR